jgi:phosphoglycolate phosphatase
MEKYDIQNAAYVGDTQGDYEATVQAGIPFIFAAYGFGNPERWDTKIEKFEDLLTL